MADATEVSSSRRCPGHQSLLNKPNLIPVTTPLIITRELTKHTPFVLNVLYHTYSHNEKALVWHVKTQKVSTVDPRNQNRTKQNTQNCAFCTVRPCPWVWTECHRPRQYNRFKLVWTKRFLLRVPPLRTA